VCGSSLALMDGGVPISGAVAGIASGIMMESKERYALITDIQGPEDHHGDMDFKVAGTKKGITAIQMDIKVDSIPVPILCEALRKAEQARLHILETMQKAIEAPRSDISPRAPKILSLKIAVDKIGLVIGTGGKTIKELMEQSGAIIDIEDDGTVYFTGTNGTALKAKELVFNMTREFKAGETFTGVVTKLMEFGVFVRIAGNTEGLVHVSEMAPFRIERVSDYVKEGMEVPIMVKEIDDRGRVNLSIKRINPTFFEKKAE
jgi:polyribonucleotide nucleotidyltransferase